MKFFILGAVVLLAAAPASAEVRVTLHDGLVSVVARDATLRQILAEWGRVGQMKIVNGERVTGGPMSLELTNVPEQEVLDLLLRSVSGYIAAPRQIAAPNLSRYDRIIVMPAAAVARPAPVAAQAAAAAPQPQPMPPFAQPPVPRGENGEEEQPQPVNRPPVFQNFAQPQVVNPTQPLPAGPAPFQPQPVQQQPAQPAAPAPAPYPTAPFGGVAVPGMVAPTPQPNQPGVITPPGQAPNQPPPRRPGGQ